MASLFPTQFGYLPTGVGSTVGISSVFIGRSISGSFEGAGFGANGRPDPAQVVQINLGEPVGDGTYFQRGSITLNVDDILAAAVANPNLPSNLNLTLREVSVCESSVEKKMIIVGSQTYAVP